MLLALLLVGCVDRDVTVRFRSVMSFDASEHWRGGQAKAIANVDKRKP